MVNAQLLPISPCVQSADVDISESLNRLENLKANRLHLQNYPHTDRRYQVHCLPASRSITSVETKPMSQDSMCRVHTLL